MPIVSWDTCPRYVQLSFEEADDEMEVSSSLQGVIRNEKDLDYLGTDFKNEFKRRQVNMQNPDGWDNL